MIPAPVVTLFERLIRERWTGTVRLDFKDGNVRARIAKTGRGEKARATN